MTPEEVIQTLNLEPLPHEGGYFRETYRAAATIPASSLPERHTFKPTDRPRNASTQIYYLLTTDQTSSLHRVAHDEIFHHYMGDPVTQLIIDDRPHTPTGLVTARLQTIGPPTRPGSEPQRLAPAHLWQGAELAPPPGGGHGFALLGCTVAPGFDWDDFELITERQAAAFAEQIPDHVDLINRLTPVPGRTRA